MNLRLFCAICISSVLSWAFSQECANLLGGLSKRYIQEIRDLDHRIDHLNFLIRRLIKGDIAADQVVKANDDLIPALQLHIFSDFIETRIDRASMNYKGRKLEFDRLELVGKDSLIMRVKEELGVKKVVLDLVETDLEGNAGFFCYGDELASINLWEFIKQYDPDHISGTLRHELSHAQFANARKRGIRSIYSNQYYSLDDAKVGVDIYKDYLSAEELYNYVGDPYGALKILRRYQDFSSEIAQDLVIVRKKLDRIEEYTGQVATVAQEFADTIDRLKKARIFEIKKAISFDENHIVLRDVNGRRLKSFIDEQKSDFVSKFKEVSRWYIAPDELYDDFKANLVGGKNFKEKAERFAAAFMELWDKQKVQMNRGEEMKRLYLAILEMVQEEQRQLVRVRENILPQKDHCLYLLNQLEYVKDLNANTPLFLELRKQLRYLANMTRERYVGFAGNFELVNEFDDHHLFQRIRSLFGD